MFIFLQDGKKCGQDDTEQAVGNTNRASPKHWTTRNELPAIPVRTQSWLGICMRRVERLQGDRWSPDYFRCEVILCKVQRRGRDDVTRCHTASTSLSLSPSLLSRFLDDYNLTKSQQPPAIPALRPPHIPFQENTILVCFASNYSLNLQKVCLE